MAKKTSETVEEEKNTKEIISELISKISGMIRDKQAKLTSAKEQLVNQLDVTSEKYLTATGVYEALQTIGSIKGSNEDLSFFIENAQEIAKDMSEEAHFLKLRAEETDVLEMATILEDQYTKDYTVIQSDSYDLAQELMRLNLCRNVGPACDDMAEFSKHAQEEIDDTIKELKETLKENPDIELDDASKEALVNLGIEE